ncbi:MAG: hypothetical protein ABIR46_04000 [Candidatus Saccharimonadales bacterium]
MSTPENHHNHHSESQPSPHLDVYDDDDNSPEAVMERMMRLYGRSNLDDLVALSRDEEKHEAYQELLNELAYEVLATNEEFVANGLAMRSGQSSPEKQKDIKERNLELLHIAREAIVQEAGLSTEESLTDTEAAKKRVFEIIEHQLDVEGDTGPDGLLHALGILLETPEGKDRFIYPKGLFPKSTDAKWSTYIQSVQEHLAAVEALENKEPNASQAIVKAADTTRTYAHNKVSRDVDEILGFNTLPDTKWDFVKTRELIAKMRDTKFPNQQTGEKFLTENAVIEGTMGSAAVKTLIALRKDPRQ